MSRVFFIIAISFFAYSKVEAQIPDAPLTPQEWVDKMGLGHWWIFSTPQQSNAITTDYSESILDSLQTKLCINGGRLHWVLNKSFDSTGVLRDNVIDSIEDIVDDFMVRDMAICLNVSFFEPDSIKNQVSLENRNKMKNAWAKLCDRFKYKSHNLAMCPVIEFHGWQILGNPQRQDSLNVLYHELTTIFRQYNPTRIMPYKPWGSARKAEFQSLDFPFGNDLLPHQGNFYYVASFSGSAGLGDWNTWSPTMSQTDLEQLHFQTINSGSSDTTKVWGIRAAVKFRDSTGIPFWMDHWRPNYHKHQGTPNQWTMEQNLAYSEFFINKLREVGSAGAFFQTRTFWDETTNDFIRLNSNSTDGDTMSVLFIDLLRQRCISSSLIQNNKTEFNIYPNPFRNNFVIETAIIKENEIKLYSLLGEDVTDQVEILNTENGLLVHTKNLPKGWYFIKVKKEVHKVLKQ